MTPTSAARLVVLYGIGGLSDVGRHAILAALEEPTVEKITVITEYPELLDESNWECNCPGGHTNPSTDENTRDRISMVKVDNWKDPVPNLAKHFEGATAVISCLGHRQPGVKYPQLITRGLIAEDGNKQVIQAMKTSHVKRAVVCSSMGMGENIHWAGKLMKIFFWTNTRKAYKDLRGMEALYRQAADDDDIDSLLIRPTGLGEEVVPVGKTYTQEKKKGVDVVGLELAKLDCARYMVQEALNPTRSGGIVVGSEPAPSKKKKSKQ